MKCLMRLASTLGNPATCVTIVWPIQTSFAMMIAHISFTALRLYALSSACNSLCSGNISHMLHQRNSMMLTNVTTRGEIQRLEEEWTGTLVEFRHSKNDFHRFISYGGRLEQRLSLYSAVQTRHILQTICATRRNGQYIWVSETSTWRLDQSLRIFQSFWLAFFPFLRNITMKDMEKQLPWRNNKSTIERF